MRNNLYTETWDVETLIARRHNLYEARLAHLRNHIAKADVPALLVVDPNHIFYATGARNMQIFTTRSPVRYLLILQDGPVVLYDYVGCEHLASDLPTIDQIQVSEGLCYWSSGGYVAEASARFAAEITSVVRAHDPTIDRIAIDRFPYPAVSIRTPSRSKTTASTIPVPFFAATGARPPTSGYSTPGRASSSRPMPRC